MRRGSVGLVAVVSMMAFGVAGPAWAAPHSAPDVVASVWVQPGTGPLDGLGTFVYVGQPPTPGPTQGALTAYEYSLSFHTENNSLGVVVLGHKNGQKVAGFGVLPSTLVTTVPYDWKYGQIYLLFTYRLSATQLGAWVYDWTAAAWSLIGVQTVPEATGRMLPEATTMVDYDAGPAAPADATCAYYPRTDVVFSPAIGWRGGTMTLGAFKASAGYDGECTSGSAMVDGWRWYTLGEAAQ